MRPLVGTSGRKLEKPMYIGRSLLGIVLLTRFAFLTSCSGLSTQPSLRNHINSVTTRMFGAARNNPVTIDVESSAPPPQYTGDRLDNGTWVDAYGIRNGPPVNFWKSNQFARLLTAQAELLHLIDGSGETDDAINKIQWFEKRNGQRNIATSPKIEGYWVLNGVLDDKGTILHRTNLIQSFQLLPADVGHADNRNLDEKKRLQPGVKYAQRTRVSVEAGDGTEEVEWVSGFHRSNRDDQNIREFGFDYITDSLKGALPFSVRCTYLDHGLRIERSDDGNKVLVFTQNSS